MVDDTKPYLSVYNSRYKF